MGEAERDIRRELQEAMEELEHLDPASERMQREHQHQAMGEARPGRAGRRYTCACGAHREAGLVTMGRWVGGEAVGTAWERAHLEVARRAVEENAPLLELHGTAVQDLHRTLLNDPPEGTEEQDLTALAVMQRVARGAARRMLEWQQRNREDGPGRGRS